MSMMMGGAAASGAMSMASSYMEGKAQAGAQKAEAKQLKQEAQRARISAQNDENLRREELALLTSSNVVDAAARGQDAFMGSTGNVIEMAQKRGERQVQQERFADEAQIRKLDHAAKVKKAQAKQTMTATYMKMASTAISTGTKMFGAS